MPTRNLNDEERETIGSWCHEELCADALIVPRNEAASTTKEKTMNNIQLNSEIDRRTQELLALQQERMRRIKLAKAKTRQPKEQLNARR